MDIQSHSYELRERNPAYYVSSLCYSLVLLLIVLFSSISNIFDNIIVRQIFNDDVRDGLPLFYLAILGVSLLIFFRSIYRRFISNTYYLQLKYSLLLLTIALLYWYNRIVDNYEFFPIFQDGKWSAIKILDIPFTFYSYVSIVLLVKSLFRRKTKSPYRNSIITDKPLESLEQDQYERNVIYKSLLDSIKNSGTDPERSTSIGLVNSWGEGKTSFLKFLITELRKDQNTIIIEFNPWYSSDKNNITLDFFQTLDAELSKFIYTGSMIREYARNLTNVDSIFNPLKYLPDKWMAEKSNQRYFEDINRLIKKLSNRIIVIIDDLDRLNSKEVFGVFQVIRNSADFANIIFITPFDKDYIVQSLTANEIPNPQEYVKKMFDVELTLPAISKFHLINVFSDHFKERLNTLINLTEEDERKLNEQIGKILSDSCLKSFLVSKYSLLNKYFFGYLKNKRDIIRYVNSVTLSISEFHKIIYLPDLLILELIKYINIVVYRRLFENRNYLIYKSDKGSFIKKHVLFKKDSDSAEYSDPTNRFFSSTINEFDIRMNADGRIDVADLIEELFKEPLNNDFRSELSIYYSQNYSNYHQLNQEGITQEEIEQLFDKDGRSKILKYIDQNKELELLEQLELLGLDEYNDKYKQLVGILFVLLNHTKNNFLPIQQFLFKTIYKVLNAVLKNDENIDELVGIIRNSVDRDGVQISYFIGRFILNIKDGIEGVQDLQNIFSLEGKLKQLNIVFLRNLISNKRDYEYIIQTFYNCVDSLEKDRKIGLHPDAISAFFEYANESPEGYLSHFIRPSYSGPAKHMAEYYLHVSEPFYEQIFNKSGFGDFLDNISKRVDTILVEDIRSFHTKASSNPNNAEKGVMLFSNDYEYSHNRWNHLKLKSDKHMNVVKSCLPPRYEDDNNL